MWDYLEICANLDTLTVNLPWKICNFKHTCLCTDLQNPLTVGVTYSFLEIRSLFQHLILRLFQQSQWGSKQNSRIFLQEPIRFLPDQVATG